MNGKKELFSVGFFLMAIGALILIHRIFSGTGEIVHRPYHFFKFFNLKNDPVPVDAIGPGKVTIILFADPECGLCLSEVKDLCNIGRKIPNLRAVLVVSESLEQAQQFNRIYSLTEPDSFYFLYDKDRVFTTCFGRHAAPSIFIIKNHCLVKSFQGEASIRAIMMAVNENVNH